MTCRRRPSRPLVAGLRPSEVALGWAYSSNTSLSVKVLDFVKSGGPLPLSRALAYSQRFLTIVLE